MEQMVPGPPPARGSCDRSGPRRVKVRSDGQEIPRTGVRRRMAKLGHGPRLDLADPLTGQVEVLAHLFERARLATVETETQAEDLALPLVERREQATDLFGEEGDGGHFEG